MVQKQWLVKFNTDTTKYSIFSQKLKRILYQDLHLDNKKIKQVKTIQQKYEFQVQINEISSKSMKRLMTVKRIGH